MGEGQVEEGENISLSYARRMWRMVREHPPCPPIGVRVPKSPNTLTETRNPHPHTIYGTVEISFSSYAVTSPPPGNYCRKEAWCCKSSIYLVYGNLSE